MKLFNPFKPHIVQFGDGAYGVRRLEVFFWSDGWAFLDLTGRPMFVYRPEKWGRGTLEWARARLQAWHEMDALSRAIKAATRSANKHKAIK